jgi:hypothetical protein
MNIKLTSNATTVTLSESNVKELYALMSLRNVERDRGRLSGSMPLIWKMDEGKTLVVQIERDLTHYPDKLGTVSE